MNELTDIKIIKGAWLNGKYKYNVELWYNDTYAGHGKFVRTYEDAKEYIIEELKGVNNESKHITQAKRGE